MKFSFFAPEIRVLLMQQVSPKYYLASRSCTLYQRAQLDSTIIQKFPRWSRCRVELVYVCDHLKWIIQFQPQNHDRLDSKTSRIWVLMIVAPNPLTATVSSRKAYALQWTAYWCKHWNPDLMKRASSFLKIMNRSKNKILRTVSVFALKSGWLISESLRRNGLSARK